MNNLMQLAKLILATCITFLLFLFNVGSVSDIMPASPTFQPVIPAVSGIVAVFIVDFIIQAFKVKDENWRFITASIVCCLIGVFLSIPELASGHYVNLQDTILVVFAFSQGTFKLFWKNTNTRVEYLSHTPEKILDTDTSLHYTPPFEPPKEA